MELEVLRWINLNWHGSPFINGFWQFITNWGCVVFLGVGIVLVSFKRTRRSGSVFLIGLLLASVITMLVKLIVFVPRPFVLDSRLSGFTSQIGQRQIVQNSSSFPSIHAAFGFAAATMMAYLYRWRVGVAGVALAGLIAFSRVFLCVHYPSDVIVGGLIGIAAGGICCYGYCSKHM